MAERQAGRRSAWLAGRGAAGARRMVAAVAQARRWAERGAQAPRRRGAHGREDEMGRVIAGGERHMSSTVTGGAPVLPFGVQDAVRTERAAPDAAAVAVADGAARGDARGAHALVVWHFAPTQEPRQIRLEEAPALIADDVNFVWVDVAGYTEEELRAVGQVVGMPRQAVRAALAPWQRPRLAVYPGSFFVSVTVPQLDPEAHVVHASELDLFIGRNVCVSAHKTALPFGAHLQARALVSPELTLLDAAYMLYLLLDELLVYYEELNRHVEGEIEQMEERALRDPSERFLEDLLRFKRYTFALAQLADQHREVFAAFLRPDFRWVEREELREEIEEDFGDLERRLTRLLDTLRTAREAINGAFEIYVSTMSHRTNQVIKLLTLVSTVLLPASLILGVFGTTIANSARMALPAGPVGLLLMLGCMALVSGGIVVVFRLRGWL